MHRKVPELRLSNVLKRAELGVTIDKELKSKQMWGKIVCSYEYVRLAVETFFWKLLKYFLALKSYWIDVAIMAAKLGARSEVSWVFHWNLAYQEKLLAW